MYGPIGSVAAYILTLDRPVTGFVLLLSGLVALAVTGIVSRDRRWLEVVSIFLGCWLGLVLCLGMVVQSIVDRNFVRLEVVRMD